MNPAEFLLGDLYHLYDAALGSTTAWVLGHLTLIAIVLFSIWLIRNWSDVANGLDLRLSTVKRYVAILVIIGLTYFMYTDTLGFPFIGAFSMSLVTTLFLAWCYDTMEGQPA